MESDKAGVACLFLSISLMVGVLDAQPSSYGWLAQYYSTQSLINRIPEPDGYQRVEVITGGFADWLGRLPLKPDGSAVHLYNGELKSSQEVHHAVINIDTGNRDLQQCADAVMRLKAEYHFGNGDYRSIHFNFTSGDTASFGNWMDGLRPRVSGSVVEWVQAKEPDSSYSSFRDYMDKVFTYAGTYSLSQELQSVDVAEMAIGDVFLRGGFPGHGVLVVDMAKHVDTGKKIFLLAQSYMPAQDMHILRNWRNPTLSPWYEADFADNLYTPEWTFSRDELRRFQW